MALAESKADHDALVAAAQARVSAAQEALSRAQTAYNDALAIGVSLESQIAQAQQDLQNAQNAYDQSLILDSSWVRPTKEVQIATITYTTTQVPHTSTVTETSQVARTVTSVVPSGLVAKSYNMYGYNNRPPLPTDNRLVSTEIVPNINFNWSGGQVLSSGLSEDVIVNFSGNLYAPVTGSYLFYAPADDGVKLLIDNNLVIDDWYDKGGGGSTVSVNLTQGTHTLTLWYYENGGGANVWLYWEVPGYQFTIVPSSAFGEQTVTTIVYDTVTTTKEVTTYTTETTSTTTYHTETVPDETAIQPMIKDASLLPAILSAQNMLNTLIAKRNENSGIIEATSKDVTTKQEELRVAQQELEAIPSFREPTPTPSQTTSTPEEPTKSEPEPLPTPEQTKTSESKSESELRVEENLTKIANLTEIAPENLTDSQISQLVEAANIVFETASQGSPEYNQALEALAIAAEADDPELPTELAAIPGAAAVLEAFNNLGNVGADMSPQIREEAEKTVIASVIAAGAAVSAVSAAAASATSSGGGTSRRNQ